MALVPIRLAILQTMSDHLKGLDLVQTGLTMKNQPAGVTTLEVYRGKAIFGANMPLPCVSILEAPRQTDGDLAAEEFTTAADDWVLLIQGWVEDDVDNPTDSAYVLAAYVQQRIADFVTVDPVFGQPINPALYMMRGTNGGHCVHSIKLAPPVVRPPIPNISDKAFFYLPVTIRFAIDIREPFMAPVVAPVVVESGDPTL